MRSWVLGICLFLLSLIIIGSNLDKPFWGIHDWNGARYGTIARNYLKWGLVSTKLGQIENGEVNTHYPPLFPLLLTLSYFLLGVSEFSTRIVPTIATAGSILLLWQIGKKNWNSKVGIAAAFLALTSVVVRYYGKMPVHEPIAFFFAMLAFYSVATKRKKLLSWAVFFCLATNWLGFYLVVGLTVMLGKKAWPLWLISAGVGILHLAHTWWLTGSIWGGGLWDIFLQRTSLGSGAVYTPFTLGEWIRRMAVWSGSLYSVWFLVLALMGSYIIWRFHTKEQKKLWLALVIYGVGYALTFPNAAFIHDYFIFGTLAIVSLSAGVVVDKLRNLWAFELVLVWILVWYANTNYVNSLQVSHQDQLAVVAGQYLNNHTSPTESILVEPKSFAASRRPQLSFYSQRDIRIDDQSEYNWILIVDEQQNDYELISNHHRP